MRQTAKRFIDWLDPWWEATEWEESGMENRNRRRAGGQLETPAHSSRGAPGVFGVWWEVERRLNGGRSAVLLVLELLMWLETLADMDRHRGWGGAHGVAQLMGSTTEGTSFCEQGGKSVSRTGTSTIHMLPHGVPCTHLQKTNQGPTPLIPEPMHSGTDKLLQWRRMGKRGVKGREKRESNKNPAE